MIDSIKEEIEDNELEREAVIALVMSDKALSIGLPYLDSSLFSNYVTKNVADWCKDFYIKYSKAPKQHIQDIFLEKKSQLDDPTVELLEIFLSRLSDLFENMDEYNEDYSSDQLLKYINLAKINLLIDDLGNAGDFNDVEKAEKAISEFTFARKAITQKRDLLTDLDDELIGNEESTQLFRLPGALDQLLGPICKSTFYAILAPEKRGKTQLLDFIMRTALKSKKRCLFISAGDMTLREIAERNKLVATKIDPRRINEKRVIYRPVIDCKYGQEGKCPNGVDSGTIVKGFDNKKTPEEILSEYEGHTQCSICRKAENEYDRKNFKPAIWWEMIEDGPHSLEELTKRKEKYDKRLKKLAGKNGFLHYMFFPTKTLTPEMIEEVLKSYKDSGTPIEVLGIDYADILKEPIRAHRMDERNKINATWEDLRRISQVYDLNLWAPTQGSKNTYKFDAEQGDASEDKRKAAHVTGMIALNQKPHEQDQGIVRVSVLFLRDGSANRMREATVLQCFSFGEAHISSFISSKTYEVAKAVNSKKSILGQRK